MVSVNIRCLLSALARAVFNRRRDPRYVPLHHLNDYQLTDIGIERELEAYRPTINENNGVVDETRH